MEWDQSKVNVEFEGENYYLAGSQMGLFRANRVCLLDVGLTMVRNPKELVKVASGRNKQAKKAQWKLDFLWALYKNLMEADIVEQPVTDGFGRKVIRLAEQSRFANPNFEKSMVEGANDAAPNHTFRLWEANFSHILPHLVWQRHVPNDEGYPEQGKLDKQLEPTYNLKRQNGLTAIRKTYEEMAAGEPKEYMTTQIPEWILTFNAEEHDEAHEETLKNA